MGRMAKILVGATLMMVLSAGVALASSPRVITGTEAGEQIKGTKAAETIYGLGGSDEITDGLGTDLVYGGKGKDNLIGYGGDTSLDRFYGGSGDDLIQPGDRPALKDVVRCGPGTDTVYADKKDDISGDCERVRVL
jgi:Ca2+-binding RTX toxin-like protein